MASTISKENKLPTKGVLFLGGHQNMIKKLKQYFPDWTYLTDDQLKRCSNIHQSIVFYWTSHGSHKLMRYVFSKLQEDVNIIYVTATNLPRLISEMENTYLCMAS